MVRMTPVYASNPDTRQRDHPNVRWTYNCIGVARASGSPATTPTAPKRSAQSTPTWPA